jgi:hypothetical protein
MGVHYNTWFRWTPEQRVELERLLREGLSASQIGAHFGVSRNVVIGKVDRDQTLPRLSHSNGRRGPYKVELAPSSSVALPTGISLPGGKTVKAVNVTGNRGNENEKLRARVRARQAIDAGTLAPPVIGYRPERFHEGFSGQHARITDIMHLKQHHCRFPLDLAGGGVGYCGTEKEPHSAYCPHHAARCFNPESAAMTKRIRNPA